MQIIKDKNFPNERDLYNTNNAIIENCSFSGQEDGESALKESSFITLKNCFMDLRYPLWHVKKLTMHDCTQTEKCRAALWYVSEAKINSSNLMGIKALRECKDVQISNCKVNSAEFGWHTVNAIVENSTINGEYAFFQSKDLTLNGVKFSGKYSFQYCENLRISKCTLNTKDAFWHANKVVVEDCEITGEYIAWYSEEVTFIRCKIKGTQPFCYCKKLTLIDCEMVDADLAFEYSEANANLKGKLISVKNFLKGTITVDEVDEIIFCNSVYKANGKIVQRNKKDSL